MCVCDVTITHTQREAYLADEADAALELRARTERHRLDRPHESVEIFLVRFRLRLKVATDILRVTTTTIAIVSGGGGGGVCLSARVCGLNTGRHKGGFVGGSRTLLLSTSSLSSVQLQLV